MGERHNPMVLKDEGAVKKTRKRKNEE